MHLFVGNTPFEVRDQQISDHRHVFVRQKGYIEMDQKLQRKMNFVPVAVAGKRKRAMLLDAKETKKRSSKCKSSKDVSFGCDIDVLQCSLAWSILRTLHKNKRAKSH